MASCDTQDLLDASACYQCIDPFVLQYVELAVKCAILKAINPMAVCDIPTLLEASKCYQCIEPGLMPAVNLAVDCEILQAGGGGTVCNRCEEFDPNAPATCDCAHWTNTLTGEMWYWRALTAEWIKYVTNT